MAMFKFGSKNNAEKGWTAWLQVDENVPTPIGGPCSLGRAKTNTICIPTEKVSRLHALVHAQEAGQYWLIDLGSSNGTYLNGRRVIQPVCLKDNDLIQIGEHRILFSLRAPTSYESDAILSDEQMTVRDTQLVPCWFLVADIENLGVPGNALDSDRVAQTVGEWFASCNRIIDEHQGTVLQYLGDGLVAYWDGTRIPVDEIIESTKAFKRMQNSSSLKFRVCVHFGKANIAASPIMGDTGFYGRDVNVLPQMKKVARSLSVPCILSEEAYEGFSRPTAARRLAVETPDSAEKTVLYEY